LGGARRAAGQEAAPNPQGSQRPGRLRRAAVLVGGVAVTALGGYLVAALLIFPAPLLPNERTVPRVIGTPVEEAQRALQAEGLRTEIAGWAPHPTYDAGLVTWQDPSPGVAAPRGSAVALTVSQGRPRRVVPDVRGLDPELAQHLLWAAGLTVGSVDTVPGTLPSGVAAATDPTAGDSTAAGSSVHLHLAKGTK
jgi:beta-lactam-binding protein with PASTA domain